MKFLVGALLGLCIASCTIRPDVSVDRPVVNVNLCIEIIGHEETLVECDAGEGVDLVDAGK